MADNIIHETHRNTKAARATQKKGCRTPERQLQNPPNRSNRRGIPQLGCPLERRLQKIWPKCPKQQTASVKAMQTVQKTAFKTPNASFERPKSKRLQNRLVDTAKDCTDNKKTLRPILSAFRGLVYAWSDWLELSETTKTGKRTQRAGHSRLAKEGLATYKKKPKVAVKPSYLLMKAALCCNRLLGEHGRQKAKHLFNIAGAKEGVCRPFLLSVSLRGVGDWACISLSRTATSSWMILRHLFRCFWNIFPKVLCWFLTAGWFIAGQKEGCVRGFPCVLLLNGFRLMPQSLIRLSRSGITASTASLPTIFQMMCRCLKKPYVILSNIFVHKKVYYVRSSKKPD